MANVSVIYRKGGRVRRMHERVARVLVNMGRATYYQPEPEVIAPRITPFVRKQAELEEPAAPILEPVAAEPQAESPPEPQIPPEVAPQVARAEAISGGTAQTAESKAAATSRTRTRPPRTEASDKAKE